jgi:methylmalonyl-CoA mutase cobalamin-binding subunit
MNQAVGILVAPIEHARAAENSKAQVVLAPGFDLRGQHDAARVMNG